MSGDPRMMEAGGTLTEPMLLEAAERMRREGSRPIDAHMTDPTAAAKTENVAVNPMPVDQTNAPRQIMLTDYMAELYSKWTATHPGQNAPIMLDAKGNPVWLNRAQRRAMAKQGKK